MHRSPTAVVRSWIGPVLLLSTAACSVPLPTDVVASPASCHGTHGSWTALHGSLRVTMELRGVSQSGWFGDYWVTMGSGTITRVEDGSTLAEFRVSGGHSPCDRPLVLVAGEPDTPGLDWSAPLFAKLTAAIGFEPGGRVMRGMVDLNGHLWTQGPHPLAGVEMLVFREP